MKIQFTQEFCFNSNIKIFGPRASGKNPYLSLLSIWNKQKSKTSIAISSEASSRLKSNAKLLLTSQELPVNRETIFCDNVLSFADNLDFYCFSIQITKEKFIFNKKIKLLLTTRIYIGEFFDFFGDYNSSIYRDYLKDSTCGDGYLFLIDGTSQAMDTTNSESLEKLLEDITQLWPYNNFKKPRFAFALTKCEFPDLYVNRDDPRGIVTRRFPKMQEVSETWAAQGYGEVEYFATSAFGVFGEYSEPNSIILQRGKLGTIAVIKNPSEWTPFGLVEPLYWLCTGKHL
jgi:hypothetical protein